jgi:hypothetical protein
MTSGHQSDRPVSSLKSLEKELTMREHSKRRINAAAIGIFLLTAASIAPLCFGANLTKPTGEVLDGDFFGIIVLHAESPAGESGSGSYLLCAGKQVSAVSSCLQTSHA